MKQQLYVAIHTHKYGVDVYPLLADHEPGEDEAIAAHDIDFESDFEGGFEDEYLEIICVGPIEEIPTIGAAPDWKGGL